ARSATGEVRGMTKSDATYGARRQPAARAAPADTALRKARRLTGAEAPWCAALRWSDTKRLESGGPCSVRVKRERRRGDVPEILHLAPLRGERPPDIVCRAVVHAQADGRQSE